MVAPHGARPFPKLRKAYMNSGTKVYNIRKLAGLCPQCGKIPQKGKYCDDCLLYSRLKLLRRSGVSASEVDKARKAWGKFIGICDACWRHNSCGRWCFDHDHLTLKFRGIIGENCNRALGLVNDNPEILSRLRKYLTY